MVSLLQHMLSEKLKIENYKFLAESMYDMGPYHFYEDVMKLKSCKDAFVKLNGQLYLKKPMDCPDELIKLINKVKHETSRGIQTIYINWYKNTGALMFEKEITKCYGEIIAIGLGNKIDKNVKPNGTLYHVCPRKYVEQIKREGLKARQAEFNYGNKDIITNNKECFSGQVFCYKALFAIRSKEDCKEIARSLRTQNPYLVTFTPGRTTWYVDSTMNNAKENNVKSSCFTFDDIPASQILEIEPLK